jgi:hypothetical protein
MWVLPLAGYALLAIVARRFLPSRDLPEIFLAASVALGALVVLVTEGLSAVRAITSLNVTLAWTVVCAALFFAATCYGDWWVPWLQRPRTISPLIKLMLVTTGVVVLITGLTAVQATSTNHDSMTYHLSRVMHWAQNRSLEFYPTNIPRQLSQPPAAEMILLQLYLLKGDDQWFNLVQWLSMIGSLIAVSTIARRLGAEPRGQLLAACLCALLPMGILQASSTQNSYVLAFWLLVLALELIIFAEKPTLVGAVVIGSSLGLAFGTKGSGYVFGVPLVLVALVQTSFWRLVSVGLLATSFSVAAVAALLLNAGQYSRNFSLYGSPIGPGKEEEGNFSARYLNDEVSIQIIASNLLRNLALQIQTGLPQLDIASKEAIERAHSALGIAPNDPRSTWATMPFDIGGVSRDEDGAGNLVHLFLIGLTFAIVVAVARYRSSPLVTEYTLALVGGVLLFATLLQWQPWHARLHVTWFVLAMPLVGLVIGHRSPILIGTLVVLAAAWSWPALIASRDHPLFGDRSVFALTSHEQIFVNTPDLGGDYREAAQLANGVGCGEAGLHLGSDDAEYPWWRLIQPVDGMRRLEHVGVMNPTAQLARPDGPFHPCLVMSRRDISGESVTLDGHSFSVQERFGRVTVLRPTGEPFPIDSSIRVQPLAQWTSGESRRFETTMTNTGVRAWESQGPDAVQLSIVLSSLDAPPKQPPREIRIPLPRDIAPGDDWAAAARLTAPGEPGKYALRHRLVHGNQLHPYVQQVDVEVVQPPQQRRGR